MQEKEHKTKRRDGQSERKKSQEVFVMIDRTTDTKKHYKRKRDGELERKRKRKRKRDREREGYLLIRPSIYLFLIER